MQDRAASCPPFPELMDYEQVAAFLHLPNKRSVARYVRLGKLPAPVRLGRRMIFRKSAILVAVEALEEEPRE